MISEYLDSLASALSFDRALARTLRDEVEDHLREIIAADRDAVGVEAERRAIARFGDPHVLAAQFAVVSLTKQSRKIAVLVLVALVVLFIAMKARVGWYALTQWTIAEDMKRISGIIGSVDHYAFWLSVIVGIGCWAYLSSCRIPTTFGTKFQRQLRNFFFLCAASICALCVSVASDGILTGLRLLGPEWSIKAAIPIASMTIEIACVCVVAIQAASYLAYMRRASAAMAAIGQGGRPS